MGPQSLLSATIVYLSASAAAYLVSASVRVAEAWSTRRLRFEPKGWQREFRAELRAAIAGLLSDEEPLSAHYRSPVRERCETRNSRVASPERRWQDPPERMKRAWSDRRWLRRQTVAIATVARVAAVAFGVDGKLAATAYLIGIAALALAFFA